MFNLFKSPAQKWQEWNLVAQTPAPWHVLDMNRHCFAGHNRVLHLERHLPKNKKEIINIFPESKQIELIAGTNSLSFNPQQWQKEVVTTLENHLAPQIERFKQKLKETAPASGDITTETRGEEWLKTSLLVLERALAGLTHEQILQTTVFVGERNTQQELRMIVFNLDLTFSYHAQVRTLYVTCFNKKDQDEFDYSKPDFEGAFQARAYPVFDLAIRLSQQISEAIIRELLQDKR